MKYVVLFLFGLLAANAVNSAEREAHAVSVYSGITSSGGTSRNNEEGAVSVTVNRPGKSVTLVVSASVWGEIEVTPNLTTSRYVQNEVFLSVIVSNLFSRGK